MIEETFDTYLARQRIEARLQRIESEMNNKLQMKVVDYAAYALGALAGVGFVLALVVIF